MVAVYNYYKIHQASKVQKRISERERNLNIKMECDNIRNWVISKKLNEM